MDSNDERSGLDLGGGEADAPVDPFAGVPADVPGEEPVVEEAPGGLGGDGATLDELEAEQASEAPINAEEGDPAPLPVEEPAPAAEEAAAPEPEPEPAPAAPEPTPEPQAAQPSPTKKEGTAQRPYVVLVVSRDEDGNESWSKVTEEPIIASQGEIALKQAYAELVPADSEESKTLVVIPVHYWKPKTVSAKAKVERAVEIS